MTIPANSTLWIPEVEAVLERRHVLADNGDEALGEQARSDPAWKTANSRQKATMLQDALYAEIRPGDAIQTLKDAGGTIDLLFLDGWKELYLNVLHLTLSSLRPGSVVLADDISLFPDQLAPYLEYVRNPGHGFVSVPLPIGDGIEYSLKL